MTVELKKEIYKCMADNGGFVNGDIDDVSRCFWADMFDVPIDDITKIYAEGHLNFAKEADKDIKEFLDLSV